MKKRMICLLLTIVMLVGLLPVTGLAATVTNITVTNPEYYDSGALKSITANFNWGTNPPKGRLVLATKYLRSEGSNGYTYGDFTDRGYYADNFNFTSFDAVLAHDQANRDLGLITYTDEKSISYSNNTMTLSFAEGHIPLSKNGTYYVYFWTYYRGEYYPDNLIMAIEVNNGGVSYTVANSSEGRNALSSTSNQVTSSNTYDVIITAAENMTKTEDSGAAMQSNLNSAMTPVVFTANDGYTFPENYAVNTTNGIMVSRDNAEQITVYGTPTSNTTITLPAPTSTGYRVSFDANGGTGTVPTQDATVQGGTFTIPDADGLTKDGYTFSGWNDGEKTYAAGDTYTMPAKNVTFTANWEETVARYDLWVGGVQITSENKGNLIQAINDANNATVASGGISYAPDTNTLTLNNFSYEGAGYQTEYYSAAICALDNLNIKLVGTNNITCQSNDTSVNCRAISVWYGKDTNTTGHLTITGTDKTSDKLICTANDGIVAVRSVTVDSATIQLNDGAIKSVVSDVTINNSVVAAAEVNGGYVTVENSKIETENELAASDDLTITNSTVTGGSLAAWDDASVTTISASQINVTGISACVLYVENQSSVTAELVMGKAIFFENSTVRVTGAELLEKGKTYAIIVEGGVAISNSTVEAYGSEGACLRMQDSFTTFVPVAPVYFVGEQIVTDDGYMVTAGADKASATEVADPTAETYASKYVRIVPAYTVTYMVGEDEVYTEKVEPGKDVVHVPEVPAKEGYAGAWSADGKNITSDTEINAVYTINQYTITFDTDGGSEIKAVTQDYGTAVTAPADPTKTGYTFAGWNAEIPTTMPAENMTIKAKWNINKYTVTYKADGQVVKTVEVEHGKDAAAPEIPAKEGYTAAWSADGKNITADTEINAVYTINKYTVTYKADGKVVKTVEVEHGKDATAPEIPAKEGYNETAPKWNKDGKNITADTTINAVYTKNQPGTFTSITPTTNAGGGKLTDKVHELKEKIPFTQEEALQIEYGADVEVWLEVKDISASVPADDKKEIEKKLGDGDVAMYLDVVMFKQVGENEASRLTQLSDKVQITFELPDSYINTDKDVTRTYSIIHVHDGKAEVITPVFDAATKTLTFETDRFSTYGVVYTDEKITPPAEETVPPAQETTAPTEATKPASKVPETGDSFQPAFWIACMTLSIFGIAVLLLDAMRRHAR